MPILLTFISPVTPFTPAVASDSSCPLFFKKSEPLYAPLEAFRQRYARFRVNRKIENLDFKKIREYEKGFLENSELKPTLSSFEEEIAFVNVDYSRRFGSENDFQSILEGRDWVKKRRLLRGIEGMSLGNGSDIRKVRTSFQELRLLREGSELSVLDLLGSARGSKLERSLRLRLEYEVAAEGLIKSLDRFKLLASPNRMTTLRFFFASPHTQFSINLIMNIFLVIPHYGLYVGRLPAIPWFKISSDEIESILLNGLSEKTWLEFKTLHGDRYARAEVYTAVSQVLLAVTASTVFVLGEMEKIEKEKEAEKKGDEVGKKMVTAASLATQEILKEAATENKTSAFEDAMEQWVIDYAKDHGGALPDTLSEAYRETRETFRKAFQSE